MGLYGAFYTLLTWWIYEERDKVYLLSASIEVIRAIQRASTSPHGFEYPLPCKAKKYSVKKKSKNEKWWCEKSPKLNGPAFTRNSIQCGRC